MNPDAKLLKTGMIPLFISIFVKFAIFGENFTFIKFTLLKIHRKC